jgi:hypothetical protein
VALPMTSEQICVLDKLSWTSLSSRARPSLRARAKYSRAYRADGITALVKYDQISVRARAAACVNRGACVRERFLG